MNELSGLYRCSGCRQYSTYNREGELTGVTYYTKHYYSSDEEDNRCDDCGALAEDFDEIPADHVERLVRKLKMPLADIAKYLNDFRL